MSDLSIKPKEVPHIVIDFDIKEYPKRFTVKQKYPRCDFAPRYGEYVIIGIIKNTGEDLVVPPEFGHCTFGHKQDPRSPPATNHVNHPALQEIINGPASKES